MTAPSTRSTGALAGWRNIPQDVAAVGFVSLFMDLSSEMVASLLPVFLVSVLGASPATFGVIEGVLAAASGGAVEAPGDNHGEIERERGA